MGFYYSADVKIRYHLTGIVNSSVGHSTLDMRIFCSFEAQAYGILREPLMLS